MKELLSPAGNMEMLYQAIHNNADAVYLGGKNFGARAYSDNFDKTELLHAVTYAHTYGVKVYVTANTIIYEEEVKEFISYIKYLYEIGVDAVIMQDIGMMSLVHEIFPNLEIHASTQCHNHNKEGIEFLQTLGVKRVVLDREMSLEEINNLNIDIEKEIFIHGALCICYSGCCLMSSLNGGRSGNRGSCVGSCRLPYKLLKNNKIVPYQEDYLLSTKELNTTPLIEQILKSNITSLKIEGRMKSPYYVGYVTKIYRTLIDNYYNNLPLNIDENITTNLKKLFNRSFTKGYLFKDNIINQKSPNHQGIPLGTVTKITPSKIYIKLDTDISMEDGIRFKKSNTGMILNKIYNTKGLLVNHLNKNDTLVIDNKISLKEKDIVLKTIDSKLNKSLENYKEKKIKVSWNIKAHLNKPLELSLSDNINTVSTISAIIEQAQKVITDKKTIKEKLERLNDTPYITENITYDIDNNIFIPVSLLNNLRRLLVENLTNERKKINRPLIIKEPKELKISNKLGNIRINVLARNIKQVQTLLDNHVDNIYVEDYALYKSYKHTNKVYYVLPRVINNFTNFKKEKLLVNELGGVYKYSKDNEVITSSYLNITNNHSINLLKEKNIKRITISNEVNIDNLTSLDTSNLEILIYGKVEAMIMKYCPIKTVYGKCINCQNIKDKYYLLDRLNNKYRIINTNCITRILNHKDINLIDKIPTLKKIGISNYQINLLDEEKEEIENILNKIKTYI